jgi:cytochrome c oxidase subunit 2
MIQFSASRYRRTLFVAPLLMAAACHGPQSALAPAGPAARSLARLGNIMYAIALLVVALVIVLMLTPFLHRGERRVRRKLFLWGGGVALPLVTLTALVPYIFVVGRGARTFREAGSITIDITGHRYWWEMSYHRPGAASAIPTANELRLPLGEPVTLNLRSADVIHSFWAPNLAGKTDLIPGRTNRMVIQADRPGRFRGQCAEYCGLQHAHMAFDIVVMPPAEFDVWLNGLAKPIEEPTSPQLLAGERLFQSLGCGGCHTVRGVSQGRLAPDLTQVGARLSIGAGMLPGGEGSIAGWIVSAQKIKPGIIMPSYDKLDGPQLRSLAAWLGSLK